MLLLSNIQKGKAARTNKLLSCLPSHNKAENLLEPIDHFKSNKFGRKFIYHLLSAKTDLVKQHETTNL